MNKYLRINSSLCRRHLEGGFTLVEVLLVVGLVGVLTGVAVPSLRKLAHSSALTSATNDVFSALLLARSEAIKHNSRVSLCKSEAGDACISSGGWDQGWIVFHDENANGLRDPGEVIVSRAAALPSGWRVVGNSTVNRYVSFDPSGATKLISGLAFQAGTITVCQGGGAPTEARQIILNGSGRPRIRKTSMPSC